MALTRGPIRRFRGADDIQRLTTIASTAHRHPDTRTDVHVRPGNAPWEVDTTSRRD